jgi:hypothetical protein
LTRNIVPGKTVETVPSSSIGSSLLMPFGKAKRSHVVQKKARVVRSDHPAVVE